MTVKSQTPTPTGTFRSGVLLNEAPRSQRTRGGECLGNLERVNRRQRPLTSSTDTFILIHGLWSFPCETLRPGVAFKVGI